MAGQAAARPEPAAVGEVMSEGEAQAAVDQAAARRLPDMPATPPAPTADGKDDDLVGVLTVCAEPQGCHRASAGVSTQDKCWGDIFALC